MAKIKVHELAKELGADKGEIVSYLRAKGYAAMTGVTAVPEGEVENLRQRFGGGKSRTAAREKTEVKTVRADGQEAPKKSKGVVRVFRSHNASSAVQKKAGVTDAGDQEKKTVDTAPVAAKKNEVPAEAPKAPAESAPAQVKAAETEKRIEPAASRDSGSREEKRVDSAKSETAAASREKTAGNAENRERSAAGSAETRERRTAESAESRDRTAAGNVENREQRPAGGVRPAGGRDDRAASVQGTGRDGRDGRASGGRSDRAPYSAQGRDMTRPYTGSRNDNRPAGNAGRTDGRTDTRSGYTGARNDGRAPYSGAGRDARQPYAGTGRDGRAPYGGTRGDGRTAGNAGRTDGRQPYSGTGRDGRAPYGGARSDGRTYGNAGTGRDARQPYAGTGRDGRAPYGGVRGDGRAAGNAGRTDGRTGFTGTRNDGRAPYGAARGDARPAFGQNQGRPAYGQGTQGRPSFGSAAPAGRGRTPGAARPAAADGALAHKTTRDYRKDGGKDYDRNREERRENGKHSQFGSRPNQNKKQFNRIPKALQHNQPRNEQPKEKEVITEIKLPEKLTVRELAEAMKMQPAALVKDLFMKGRMVTLNNELTYEQAEEIAMDYNIVAEQEEKEDVIGNLLAESEESEDDMVPRPPVVCVMGHVDHGKTSLLDAIRDTHVTDREAGGITQHIGAYMVTVNGEKITFLDTPGHEAFTAMRMRGANSTDIAVLVVAADDGVMPQTVEAINHAKAANVEIIVAVNKIDKPGANVDRVKQELSEYQLIPEDWGGSTIFCEVSAKTHEGIDNLLEMILLTAEVAELKANPNRKARGLVLEARLDKGRGPVATILVQKGTLKQGDFIACGSASGKVRAMTDEKGRRLQKATPSMPVEIIGLSSVPDAGEVLVALDSDKEAKAFAQTFITEGKKTLIEDTKTQMSLDDLFNQIKEGNLKELPIVVKADVQGSVEAVKQSLLKLSNDEVVVKVIHGGVGAITESDVSLAAASNAIIIGFNVRPDATAKAMAESQKVEVNLYSVIYEAIEDVERALKGMRAAVFEEKVLGHAEIRQIFKASGVGNIAGAYVKDGIFQRNCKIRVFRGEEKLYEGQLASLKRFKDDVKEVREGFECGLVFDGFGDFAIEDTVEAYTMVEVPRE
ncbi:MAG: translation initiation factor IF-2 [Lachnospiraceae bacterium]|nr:translation initiation factor IF-2 [Lachnospiraceae bacterium]